MATSMTREEIVQLASHVRENPCLYDPSDTHYKDAMVVKNTWDNVARMMGFSSGPFWRKRYRGFRDAYTRSQKKALVDGYALKPYKFSKEFSFLEPFLKHHDVENKVFPESFVSPNEDDDEDGSNASWAESVDGSNDSVTTTPPVVKTEKRANRGIKRPKSNRNSTSTENNNDVEDVSWDSSGLREVIQDPSVREGELFFSSCAKRMKNYTEATQELIYLQVSEIFFNASKHEKGQPTKPLTPFPPHDPETSDPISSS